MKSTDSSSADEATPTLDSVPKIQAQLGTPHQTPPTAPQQIPLGQVFFSKLKKVWVLVLVVGLFLVTIGGYLVFQGYQRTRQKTDLTQPTPFPTPSSPQIESPIPSQLPGSTPRTINIVSVTYFPVRDGRLDTVDVIKDKYNEYSMTLDEARQKVKRLVPQVKKILENGSAFQAYKNSSSEPYIFYNVVSNQEILEAVPLSANNYNGLPLPDYMSMMKRINVCDYVDGQDVKEIWLWTYAGVGKTGWESNFSSQYGDISNSNNNPNDLPRCNHSYTVYDYNYGRQASEAVEDHIHQYEAVFKFVSHDLFWNKFVGYFPNGQWWTASVGDQRRRCGWAHFPPNGVKDYDWQNPNSVETDCENWDPDSYGSTISINCQKWNCTAEKYFEWWMQNLPGENNPYTYQGRKMRNWWEFVVDFDEAMAVGKTLTK